MVWGAISEEYPGGAEYTCITRTLEKQKELLQHMYRQGEDTSQKELLVQLLRKIWKYIQLSKFTRMGLSSSLHHQDEWKLFVLPNKGDESDTFQQQVEKLLSFLKNEMAEYDTQVLDHSRYLKVVGSRAEDAALSLLIPLPSSCHAHPYKKLWKNLAINSHSCLPL
ncbi:hypothetical protein pdam_00011841 [Pocillopora damicornis]|uniref:Uncharacterized protein n=1 Tax=Pocillopora damicornis TaxID=46731 RepID=A0A3M6TMS0_POCDA|nr:hypothetical protein pdam_00011841 [Pocillopora damicornis]